MTINNRLPAGPIIVKDKSLYIGTKKIWLAGTNVAYLAVNWGTPEEFANKFYKLGYNWVRFHHVDDLIRKGQVTVERLVALCEALYLKGIRVSIDGISQYANYSKTSLYEGQNWDDYKAYLTKIAPILTHRGCFMLNLVNENFTDLKNRSLTAKIPEFYRHFKEFVRGLGFKGLVTDGGDANIDPPLFAPLMSEFDIVVAHTYGNHPQGQKYRLESWPWNTPHAGVTYQLQGLVNVPVLVQEYGCLIAQDQALNEAFYVSESRNRIAGMCSYQYASNVAEMRGDESPVSDMSVANNPARSIASALLALQGKYGGGDVLEKKWEQVNRSDVYRNYTQAAKVDVSRTSGRAVFTVSATKTVVILLEHQQIAGRTVTDNGGSWYTVTNRGVNRFGYMEAGWIDIGVPIAYVKRLNPYTIASEVSMKVSGTKFWADRGLGIYEVTLA